MSRGDVATIHLGLLVDETDFDQVFGYEIVHVIVTQKYKSSIPKWLEEDLANHLAKRGATDDKSLANQPAKGSRRMSEISDIHSREQPQ